MTRLQGDREMRGWFMTSLAAGIMVCGSLNAYAEIVTLKSGKRFESPVKEAFGDRVVLDIQGIPVTYY